jgi:hypothetical protein
MLSDYLAAAADASFGRSAFERRPLWSLVAIDGRQYLDAKVNGSGKEPPSNRP